MSKTGLGAGSPAAGDRRRRTTEHRSVVEQLILRDDPSVITSPNSNRVLKKQRRHSDGAPTQPGTAGTTTPPTALEHAGASGPVNGETTAPTLSTEALESPLIEQVNDLLHTALATIVQVDPGHYDIERTRKLLRTLTTYLDHDGQGRAVRQPAPLASSTTYAAAARSASATPAPTRPTAQQKPRTPKARLATRQKPPPRKADRTESSGGRIIIRSPYKTLDYVEPKQVLSSINRRLTTVAVEVRAVSYTPAGHLAVHAELPFTAAQLRVHMTPILAAVGTIFGVHPDHLATDRDTQWHKVVLHAVP